MKINNVRIIIGLALLLAAFASEAVAQNTVRVRFDPQNTTVAAGSSFTVKLIADIPDPVVGWGLDVGLNPSVLSLTSVDVGPNWFAASAADGDNLVGLAFPTPVSGQNTLLATLHLKAIATTCVGNSNLTASFTPTDLAEGFPLPVGDFAGVTFVNGSVAVVDSTPPSINSPSVNQPMLWPPNHKMVAVTVAYGASDNCTAPSSISCKLSVTSNEPVNGTGDGDIAPDWEIIDAHRVRLRAERAGSGKGRSYTITITCTDGNNNTSQRTVIVQVPHDQR